MGLEFENSKYEFPSPDPYRQKEMLLGWVWGFLKYYLKQRARRKAETEASRGNRAEMGFVELGKRDKKCALVVQGIGRISV